MAVNLTDAQLRVLTVINLQGPDVSIAQLADHHGGHPNASRRHLAYLEKSGLITTTTQKEATSGRPAKLYSITDAGRRVCATNETEQVRVDAITRLAAHIAQTDNAATTSYEIGKKWGESERAKVDNNPEEALTRQGFAPSRTKNEGEFDLLACPLIDAARESPEVICNMHLGYLEGAIPTAHSTLTPFASPRGCRVTIRRDNQFD